MTLPRQLLVLALGLSLMLTLTPRPAPAVKPPVIVLTAFGTSTAAFDTYKHIEARVRQGFPGYEIRWAFTSTKVRKKIRQEWHQDLKDLPQTLQDLKAAGYSRVVVQSLHVVPGEEWDKMAEESRRVAGLQVALGKPLLSSATDQIGVLNALAATLPPDLQQHAVVLVGHGSRDAKAQAAYAGFVKLLRSRYPDKNVFFGLVQFQKPGKEEVLQELQRSGATSVTIIPFLLVAGEHVNNDILGDSPDSWKSQFQVHGFQVESRRRGLGYNEGILNLYLAHLTEAIQTLKP